MKVVKLDTRVDLTQVHENFLKKEVTPEQQKAFQDEIEAWSKKPEATRGARPVMERENMTATEFLRDIVKQALGQVYKSGNIGTLKRTDKIMREFDAVIHSKEKGGIATFEDDDFKYFRSAFKKAENWQNTPEIAKALIAVDELLESAETTEV